MKTKTLKKGLKKVLTPARRLSDRKKSGTSQAAAMIAIDVMNSDGYDDSSHQSDENNLSPDLEWSVREHVDQFEERSHGDDDEESCVSFLITPEPSATLATKRLSACELKQASLSLEHDEKAEDYDTSSTLDDQSLERENGNVGDVLASDGTSSTSEEHYNSPTHEMEKEGQKSKMRDSLRSIDSGASENSSKKSKKKLKKKQRSRRKSDDSWNENRAEDLLDGENAPKHKNRDVVEEVETNHDNNTSEESQKKSKKKHVKKQKSKRDLLSTDDSGETGSKELLSGDKALPSSGGDGSAPKTETNQDNDMTEEATKKSKKKSGKKQRSKRDLFSKDDFDENSGKELIHGEKVLIKDDAVSGNSNRNKANKDNNEAEDSAKKSGNKSEKKQRSKRDLLSADHCDENDPKEVSDGEKALAREGSEGDERTDPSQKKSSNKNGKNAKKPKKQKSKRSLLGNSSHSKYDTDDENRSDFLNGSNHEGDDAKADKKSPKKNEDVPADKKKKKKAKRRLSNSEILDWLADDPPAFCSDADVYNQSDSSFFVDKQQTSGVEEEDNGLMMTILLDRVKSLEADIASLHQEREAFVSEQERLQLVLQQEADDNASLRVRVLELESVAKGDRFTSIANDAVREDLVSENEHLKEQLQREQEKTRKYELQDAAEKSKKAHEVFELQEAAEEIKNAHEAKDKLKAIVDKQKTLIDMLMDKVQKENPGSNIQVLEGNVGTSTRRRAPRRNSFTGLFGDSTTNSDDQDTEGQTVGGSLANGLKFGLQRVSSAGKLFV